MGLPNIMPKHSGLVARACTILAFCAVVVIWAYSGSFLKVEKSFGLRMSTTQVGSRNRTKGAAQVAHGDNTGNLGSADIHGNHTRSANKTEGSTQVASQNRTTQVGSRNRTKGAAQVAHGDNTGNLGSADIHGNHTRSANKTEGSTQVASQNRTTQVGSRNRTKGAAQVAYKRRIRNGPIVKCGPMNWSSSNYTVCESNNTAYISPQVFLPALVGKWVLFLGDSCTRAMVQVLLSQFDSDQTHPHNFQAWYNSSNLSLLAEPKIWRKDWLGIGGDFMVVDYIVSVVGYPKILYKNASLIFDPSVLSHHRPSPDIGTVRFTFANIRDTKEMASRWNIIVKGSTPDLTYLNVGAWRRACNVEVVQRISEQTKVIWGTVQLEKQSKCDAKMLRVWPMTSVLDRTLIPRTEVGALRHLKGPHFAHLVNLYDVMHLMQRFLGIEAKFSKTEFHQWCSIHEEVGLDRLRPPLPLPYQGWKNPWKLPCLARLVS